MRTLVVRLEVGDRFALPEVFGEPAEILSVRMEGATWRLAELASLAPFMVEPADCRHHGNRDTGRDRVVVTWRGADGEVETDHLDLRYCEAEAVEAL